MSPNGELTTNDETQARLLSAEARRVFGGTVIACVFASAITWAAVGVELAGIARLRQVIQDQDQQAQSVEGHYRQLTEFKLLEADIRDNQNCRELIQRNLDDYYRALEEREPSMELGLACQYAVISDDDV
jgi:hypothetical protein